jgi:adenylate cyclase class 2
LGFQVTTPRSFERNTLFDTPDQSLRCAGNILRLREYDGAYLLTYKGASLPGRHKVREELETTVGDAAAFQLLLARLGFLPGFRYEKFRTVYAQPDATGHLTLDETPIGPFLELEGPPTWIDHTAAALGFAPDHYITASYGQLWAQHCTANGIPLSDFVFPPPHS